MFTLYCVAGSVASDSLVECMSEVASSCLHDPDTVCDQFERGIEEMVGNTGIVPAQDLAGFHAAMVSVVGPDLRERKWHEGKMRGYDPQSDALTPVTAELVRTYTNTGAVDQLKVIIPHVDNPNKHTDDTLPVPHREMPIQHEDIGKWMHIQRAILFTWVDGIERMGIRDKETAGMKWSELFAALASDLKFICKSMPDNDYLRGMNEFMNALLSHIIQSGDPAAMFSLISQSTPKLHIPVKGSTENVRISIAVPIDTHGGPLITIEQVFHRASASSL